MQPVTSWSSPTHIVIGAGAAARYVSALSQPFVIADPVLGGRADLHRAEGMTDGEFIAQVRTRCPPGATVVAIGGGSILDPVRVAVSGLPTTGDGVVLQPAPPSAVCDVVCIPSTIGTAAEVSPVAVLDAGATMLISPALRARVAVLDPGVSANPDTAALRCGLIEPWARVMVPAVAGDGLLLQDALARCLAGVLEDLAVAPIDQQWLLSAALTSAQTHTAFVALQRSPFSHVLWPVATEYARMAAVSKQQALAILLPAWLSSRGHGDLAARVRRLWPAEPAAVDGEQLDRAVAIRWPMFEVPLAAAMRFG